MSSLDHALRGVGVGVLVFSGEAVLLGKRLSSHGAGEYSLPGGKPDEGESPEQAALRELAEETGLLAYDLIQLPLWTYDRYEDERIHFVTVYFEAKVNDPEANVQNMEPQKCAGWHWHHAFDMPQPLFSGVEEAVMTRFGAR